ncbi:zf-HC2 domain-containing protein [Streptomyces piniterrae]|uniref:Zf-HC2 domain-containing protein n=1 Tax=Streptomyces piniterrae TaxID=2571125 RepID=A0A4U0NXP0_9ACTN|nr:zf-HC2 domain-containing protein [Streptomyces piniterrae]TJZ58962.1 zf-HC2 domain-containing protein [Streptomyces piniterrae]
MLCTRIRTALSARLDGERLPSGLTDRRLDDHLEGCADCREWEAGARRLAAVTAAALGRDGDDGSEGSEAHDGSEGDGGDAAADALLARLRAAGALPATGTPSAGAPRAVDPPSVDPAPAEAREL